MNILKIFPSQINTTVTMTDRIQAELIPGTEILLASDQGYGRHSNANEELVLIPTPSDQPEDPLVRILNFSEKVCLLERYRTGVRDGRRQ
jgi:hypothetical protein